MSDNVYADLVAAQAAEIERLTRERDKALDWETVAKCNQATAQSWIARVSAAEADAAAARRSLRAALVERDQTFKVMHDRADAAEAERDALRELVKDLADDLAGEIEANYPIAARLYPSEQRRYDRDMAVVLRARAALGGQP